MESGGFFYFAANVLEFVSVYVDWIGSALIYAF